MTEKRVLMLRRKLQEARFRLLREHPDFALPLLDLRYYATKAVWRMSAGGAALYFDPDWLQRLGAVSLDFMLCHQLMHIALGHVRRAAYYRGERYHLACDIVANSRLRELGWKYGKLPLVGTIYHETFFPRTEGALLTPERALSQIPFDPAAMPPGARRGFLIDSEQWWSASAGVPEDRVLVLRPADADPEELSLDRGAIREKADREKRLWRGPELPSEAIPAALPPLPPEALHTLREIKKRSALRGAEGDFTERSWQRAGTPAPDWRRLLQSFLQEELCDYSFTPPDRRFQEAGFFLPDFHADRTLTKEVLFMVDTSASVGEEMLRTVYAALCSAIEQLDGGLRGLLSFFDTQVTVPRPFRRVQDLAALRPAGGGGTDYACIFAGIRRWMADRPPASVVIFTDGRADYPPESAAGGLPVLWLLTDAESRPPWGRSALLRTSP